DQRADGQRGEALGDAGHAASVLGCGGDAVRAVGQPVGLFGDETLPLIHADHAAEVAVSRGGEEGGGEVVCGGRGGHELDRRKESTLWPGIIPAPVPVAAGLGRRILRRAPTGSSMQRDPRASAPNGPETVGAPAARTVGADRTPGGRRRPDPGPAAPPMPTTPPTPPTPPTPRDPLATVSDFADPQTSWCPGRAHL